MHTDHLPKANGRKKMLFLRICFDKTDAGGLRDDIRRQHREYIGGHIAGAPGMKIVQAGPMCADDDLKENVGSFLVIEAESFEQVMRFHQEDPFTKAGLFERSDLVRWDRHIGNPGQTEYTP